MIWLRKETRPASSQSPPWPWSKRPWEHFLVEDPWQRWRKHHAPSSHLCLISQWFEISKYVWSYYVLLYFLNTKPWRKTKHEFIFGKIKDEHKIWTKYGIGLVALLGLRRLRDWGSPLPWALPWPYSWLSPWHSASPPKPPSKGTQWKRCHPWMIQADRWSMPACHCHCHHLHHPSGIQLHPQLGPQLQWLSLSMR